MLTKGVRKGVKRRNSTRGGLSLYTRSSDMSSTNATRNPRRKRLRGKVVDTNLIQQFVYQINRELVVSFGKTSPQAKAMIFNANLSEYLTKHPIALHDTPHEWALKLLTKNKDVEILERYYSSI